MDATLKALGALLVQAIPTVIFFIFLAFYLNRVLFRPIAKVFEERRQATEGVRELAQKAFDAAEKKTSEFEHALQIARAEMHREHEALRRKWLDEQAQELAKARADADKQIEQAKQDIAREVAEAQAQLTLQVDRLSEQMIASLLKRRAA